MTIQDTHRTSRNYAVAQTLLLFAFAGAFFLDFGPRLFTAATPGTVGAVLCVVGLLLMLLGFASIGGAIQIAPEPRVGGELVTRGVYRRLRHPIYTAIVILVAGLFPHRFVMAFGSLPPICVGICPGCRRRDVLAHFLHLSPAYVHRGIRASHPSVCVVAFPPADRLD